MLGVGALIFDENGRILMVQRGGEPLKGWWSLPGGVLETGETLAEGVQREVLEETGLQIEPVSTFEIFERIMRDPKGRAEYHYVLIDFICRVKGGTLSPADDCADAQWMVRPDLESLRITEGTLDVIDRAYRSRS
ncbi:MAG TPA: NUDIX hydrolase [Bryobacteraceae bacterium]|nr:NUDIX hydrolase [Bryobacteraceae bacterium]